MSSMEVIEERPTESAMFAMVDEPTSIDSKEENDLVVAYLKTLDNISSLTVNYIIENLRKLHNRDFNKALVKDILVENMMTKLAPSKSTSKKSKSTDVDEEEEVEDGDESDSDGSAAEATQFPEEWSSQFNEVYWVRTCKSWPW